MRLYASARTGISALCALVVLGACGKSTSKPPERLVVTPRLVYYATDRVYLQRKLPDGIPNDLRLALVERSKQDLEVEGRLADQIAKSRWSGKIFEINSEWTRPGGAGLQSWSVDLRPGGWPDPIGAVEAVEPLIWDTRARRALRIGDVFTTAGIRDVANGICRANPDFGNCPDPVLMNFSLVQNGCPEKGYLINRVAGGPHAGGRMAVFPPVQHFRGGKPMPPPRPVLPEKVPYIPPMKERISLLPARVLSGERDWSRFDVKALVKPEYQWAFGQVEGCPPVI